MSNTLKTAERLTKCQRIIETCLETELMARGHQAYRIVAVTTEEIQWLDCEGKLQSLKADDEPAKYLQSWSLAETYLQMADLIESYSNVETVDA